MAIIGATLEGGTSLTASSPMSLWQHPVPERTRSDSSRDGPGAPALESGAGRSFEVLQAGATY